MQEIIEIISKTDFRIPFEYRKDKNSAKKFLEVVNELKNKNIEIKNEYVPILERWVSNLKNINQFDEIISIEKIDTQMTYDLTVPDGSSFTANGLAVHNCNLPNNVTVDLISNVYLRAWETGCKGFTVYRDGSRSGVLISNDQSNDKKNAQINNSPKRPDELLCDIHHVHINGEKWTVLVGKNETTGKPFELFGGLSETIELPKKFTTGIIRKVRFKSKSPRYDLILGEGEDQIVVKDLVQTFSNANHGSFTRTISLTLRHGVPINYLVEQLQKDKNADMFSFSKVIARCLKKYIDDGTKSTLKLEGCDTPGQCNIKYLEGCASCLTCGISKCS